MQASAQNGRVHRFTSAPTSAAPETPRKIRRALRWRGPPRFSRGAFPTFHLANASCTFLANQKWTKPDCSHRRYDTIKVRAAIVRKRAKSAWARTCEVRDRAQQQRRGTAALHCVQGHIQAGRQACGQMPRQELHCTSASPSISSFSSVQCARHGRPVRADHAREAHGRARLCRVSLALSRCQDAKPRNLQ